jgi:hypothetical protein
VSLVLDAITANVAAFAIAAHAADREAHAREVELVGEMPPEDSYGRINVELLLLVRPESPDGCGPSSGPTRRLLRKSSS